MFAVVRTGGKQYRVAPGDKIVVEKLDGNAGDKITLGDVLLAGEGSSLKSTDGLTVAAEIIAQAKGDKVTVFKKRRRHNYRRKKGHRQQHTILKIVAIGDHKEQKKAAPKAARPPRPTTPKPLRAAAPAEGKSRGRALERNAGEVDGRRQQKSEVAGKPTPNPRAGDENAPPRGNAPAKKAGQQADGQNPVDKKCCTC